MLKHVPRQHREILPPTFLVDALTWAKAWAVQRARVHDVRYQVLAAAVVAVAVVPGAVDSRAAYWLPSIFPPESKKTWWVIRR
jgi:hypothetical protein